MEPSVFPQKASEKNHIRFSIDRGGVQGQRPGGIRPDCGRGGPQGGQNPGRCEKGRRAGAGKDPGGSPHADQFKMTPILLVSLCFLWVAIALA